jgi:hypothetical protein
MELATRYVRPSGKTSLWAETKESVFGWRERRLCSDPQRRDFFLMGTADSFHGGVKLSACSNEVKCAAIPPLQYTVYLRGVLLK